MGIFSRLSDIVNSNINALLDRAEDPEKIIRLIIQEMEDTLVEVRSAAVRTIAEKKGMERKAGELRAEHEDWQRKRRARCHQGPRRSRQGRAARQGARRPEPRRARAAARPARRGPGPQNEDIGKLQAKLADAKAREQSLAARQKTAATRLKMRARLYDERITDAFARFEQVERTLDEMEGKVEAYDLGRKPALAEEFAELEADAGVEEELEALKSRLGNRATQAAKG